MSVKRRLAGQPSARVASAPGQTTTEFLMIGGAVAAILLVVLVSFGGQVSSAFTILGRCLSSAAGGSTAGCAAGGSSAASASASSPGKPAGTLPSVFGPAGAPAGNTGSPAPGGPGAPSGGLGTGPGGSGPSGGGPGGAGSPGGAGGPGGRAPTGLPGTMGGPLVTLPPPGSVEVGPIQPTSPYSQLGWDWLTQEGFGQGTVARYGNWYGEGWWGGSELDSREGPMPPVDWLDAVAQKHDQGYAIADEMGAIYGEAEKYRIRAMADQIAARDAARLPDDPSKWVPPPANVEEARRYRDRMVTGFSEVMNNINWYKSGEPACDGCPPPQAGPLDYNSLEAEQQRRVDAWNQDFLRRQAESLNK